ncbi:MAG: hypothetical protein R3F11_05835 [Verrucomicrobiales bacterium]
MRRQFDADQPPQRRFGTGRRPCIELGGGEHRALRIAQRQPTAGRHRLGRGKAEPEQPIALPSVGRLGEAAQQKLQCAQRRASHRRRRPRLRCGLDLNGRRRIGK